MQTVYNTSLLFCQTSLVLLIGCNAHLVRFPTQTASPYLGLPGSAAAAAAAAAAAGTTAWLKVRWVMLQMMQDWLALYKLDRKQLAALAANAQAAQAYEDYLHLTVQEVVEDLLAEFDEPEAEPAPGDLVKPAPAAAVLVLSHLLHSYLMHRQTVFLPKELCDQLDSCPWTAWILGPDLPHQLAIMSVQSTASAAAGM